MKLENIIEIQNSGRIIQNHLTGIMNYFNNGYTNAFAEGLNSRIQRFVSDLRGFKDDNYCFTDLSLNLLNFSFSTKI